MSKDTEETKNNTQANEENAKSIDKVSEAVKRLFNEKEKSIDQKIREIQYNADLARMQNDQIELQDQLAKAHKLLLELGDENISMSEEQKAAFQAEKETREDLVKAIAKQMGMNEQQTQGLLKSKKAIEGNVESTKKYAKASDNLFNSMRSHVSFLFADKTTGLVGGMFEFAASMKSAEGGLGTFGKSFFKTFNFTSLATAMVNNFTESTIGMVSSFDKAAASFASATGTGDEFTGTLLEMRQEGNALGVTFENSSKALQSLAENQVGFLGSSKAARKEMATQVALLDRIGISTDISAEMMNVFTINMGKSQGAAIQMTKSLVNMGGVLGSSQKFLQNFQDSLTDLAVYGPGAVDVFSNLAAAARAAGVEVGTLTTLANRFDTFAESAETVGRLNALLGSQMSSTQMLLMTEDQRIETLIQQVQISGETFAQMDRFKQKAIAAAAGISDMNQAQRIFGMNMQEYNKYQQQMDRQAKMQENFNKAIEATIPLQEKFSQFMAEFAIFVQPVADVVGSILDGMVSLMSSMDEGTKSIIAIGSAVGLAYVAFVGLGGTLPIIGGAAAAVSAGVGSIAAAATIGGPSMLALGTAAGSAAIGMSAFALPLLGIGAVIAGVVTSIGYLIVKIVELAKLAPNLLSMQALTSSLSMMKETIGSDTSAISNALENLALIATGTAAKAAGGATANITTELKGAVEALTTTKIDIKLSIDDGKLYDIMKGAVADVISNDRTVRTQIVDLKMA